VLVASCCRVLEKTGLSSFPVRLFLPEFPPPFSFLTPYRPIVEHFLALDFRQCLILASHIDFACFRSSPSANRSVYATFFLFPPFSEGFLISSSPVFFSLRIRCLPYSPLRHVGLSQLGSINVPPANLPPNIVVEMISSIPIHRNGRAVFFYSVTLLFIFLGPFFVCACPAFLIFLLFFFIKYKELIIDKYILFSFSLVDLF